MTVDTHVYCNSLVGISQNPSLLSHPRQNSEPGLGTMGTYSLVPFPLNSVGSVSHRTLWALCMSLPSLLSSYSLLVYSLELHFCGSSLPVSQVYVHTALYSLHLSTLYLVQWWWVYQDVLSPIEVHGSGQQCHLCLGSCNQDQNFVKFQGITRPQNIATIFNFRGKI